MSRVEVRATVEDDWPALRHIRLTSLKADPEAFWSSYEDMVDQPETFWRERAASGTLFLAWADETPVGIAGGMMHAEADEQPEHHLISMWVAPAGRGQRLAARLLDAVVAWARADGAERLTLWVVDGNDTALGVYERYGFVLTGENQPFPGDDPRTESKMAIPLS